MTPDLWPRSPTLRRLASLLAAVAGTVAITAAVVVGRRSRRRDDATGARGRPAIGRRSGRPAARGGTGAPATVDVPATGGEFRRAAAALAAVLSGDPAGTPPPARGPLARSSAGSRDPRAPALPRRSRPSDPEPLDGSPSTAGTATAGVTTPDATADTAGPPARRAAGGTNGTATAANQRAGPPTGPEERGPHEPGEVPPTMTNTTDRGPAGPAGMATTVAHDDADTVASRRHRALGLLVLAALVTTSIGVLLVTGAEGGSGDDENAAAGSDADGASATTGSTASFVPEVIPVGQAFGLAADRLTGAGSFAYTGTVQATDVSHVRPGLWLGVDITVTGEVSLPDDRLHELAVASTGRATETVTDGPTVWGRTADDTDALVEEEYREVTELRDTAPRMGLTLLPTWLDSATVPQDGGLDPLGRHLYRATIPGDVLGQIEDGTDPTDADIVLTLGPGHEPVRIEVTSPPGGQRVHLALDLTRLGEPVAIEPPA